MKKVIKQVLGINVAQKELVDCLARMHDNWTPELYARKIFINSAKGFLSLIEWIKKFTDSNVAVRYVMEATARPGGVYHARVSTAAADRP